MAYIPVTYTVEFRNALHAMTPADIVNALEEWSDCNLAVTVTGAPEMAHGKLGPSAVPVFGDES